MVRLKFIVIDDTLKLRISEGKNRYYKSVAGMLVDNPSLERHWLSDKERFSTASKSSKANNKALGDFKSIYQRLVAEHPSLTAKEIAFFYSSDDSGAGVDSAKSRKRNNTVESYLLTVIEREKAKKGTNWELYHKLMTKCHRTINSFPTLTFQALTHDKMIQIAHSFAKYPGYRGTTKTFRALLGRASKDKYVEFNISQIGEFVFADYSPDVYEVKDKRPDVLTPDQLRKFLNAELSGVTPTYKDRVKVELMHDFCSFMFHTFMAPCDVIKLKASEITNVSEFKTRRKKTKVPITVPLNHEAQRIIQKYCGQNEYGYVFPIMDDKRDLLSKTSDVCTKKFRQQLNVWLKMIGADLNLGSDLYAYVFRHTAITFALDKGIPISYVAQVAGTSSEMIQKHYYNGDNHQNSSRFKEAFMSAFQ